VLVVLDTDWNLHELAVHGVVGLDDERLPTIAAVPTAIVDEQLSEGLRFLRSPIATAIPPAQANSSQSLPSTSLDPLDTARLGAAPRTLLDVYPLMPGSQWTYRYSESNDFTMRQATFTETITGAYMEPPRFAGYHVDREWSWQHLPILSGFNRFEINFYPITNGAPSGVPSAPWIVVGDRAAYEAADEAVAEIGDLFAGTAPLPTASFGNWPIPAYGTRGGTPSLIFAYPVAESELLPETDAHAGTVPQWLVAPIPDDVRTLAGRYSGCYAMTSQYGTGAVHRVFCPGVGVVRETFCKSGSKQYAVVKELLTYRPARR
jgi:hypothetical protein